MRPICVLSLFMLSSCSLLGIGDKTAKAELIDNSSQSVGSALLTQVPEGVKIVTLVRGEQVIMAHHDTVIENGDHVILFLSDKRHVEQVERLFQA